MVLLTLKLGTCAPLLKSKTSLARYSCKSLMEMTEPSAYSLSIAFFTRGNQYR